jgi:hypothetical protein
MRKTIGEIKEAFITKFTIDDVTYDPVVQDLYNHISVMYDNGGPTRSVVISGQFRELIEKLLPELLT